jgi:hypothetical protein
VPERIVKLQPDRTLALRGFDTFAAAASLHNASPSGFTASGTFRDPADFAVAVLYDADNYYEHPLLKYLPDFNFNGLTLSFDLNYTDGLQPIDSPKFNWIDWATLDLILADGTTANVTLWDYATLVGTSFPAATATVTLTGSGVEAWDRVTLWFQNLAFDYTAPVGNSTVQFAFYAGGPGTSHSVTVAGRTYTFTEPALPLLNSSEVAAGMAGAISDPLVVATSSDNNVVLTVQLSAAGTSFAVSASDGNGSATMLLTTPILIAGQLVSQINATNWVTANTTHALMASNTGSAITLTAARYGTVNVSGTTVTWVTGSKFPGILPGAEIFIGGVTYTVASVQSPTQLTLNASPTAPTLSGVQYVAPRGGRDGNLLQLYTLAQTSGTSTLAFDQTNIQLSGGSSAVTWNCALDFSAISAALRLANPTRTTDYTQIRQAWLTFAPSLTLAPYTATEWQAVFSNWTLSGPAATQALSVAGPGSVRVEEDDKACTYTGTWASVSGFYSKYFANVSSDLNDSVTVTYTCQSVHDLYIGTSLYTDRGSVHITFDDGNQTDLDCYLYTGSPVVTRRLVKSVVPAGTHTVVIRLTAAKPFYFDFLEAAVVSDVPDALTPRTGISPALDFDTDHTYKLPPARIHWIMDKLGYAGPMNEYLGVFWWNERTLSGGSVSTAQVTFSGTFSGVLTGTPPTPDIICLTLNGASLYKTVFPADTLATIAQHFAAYINSAFVGAYASASGAVLTITGRSPAPAYTLTVTVSVTSAAGIAKVTSEPVAGFYGTWGVNDAANPPINRATRDWHADFYAQCAARSRPVTTALSMELVYPPDGYVARFPDSTPVSTATGFGTLVSNHCAIGGSKMLAYQKAVYRNIAAMQAAAGLTPAVQFGEFLWWYFAQAQYVEIGYASFAAPISIGTATPHGLSTGAQVVISGVEGNTAANGTFTITVTDATHFTLNGSSGSGNYTGGGTLVGGGMAYYDDETKAAAQASLGRALYGFITPDDVATVNGSADATFLRNRLRDHVAALIADLRSAYPAAKCEVLWPYDVNYPTPVPTVTPNVGGQLNRFVNLPIEWQTQSTSGLDTMKVEALAFASSLRNLDLAREAIELFPNFGWPLNALRYLAPVFGIATPWHRELALALGAGITTNNLWAFDHVCLYNLCVPEQGLERRAIKVQ